MTETLEQIKQSIATAHELGIYNWNTSTISSLITTIESLQAELQGYAAKLHTAENDGIYIRETLESQKEEIKRLSTCQDCGGTGTNELCHDPYYVVPCICTVDWYSENMELRKQIESLKAITELAVKALEQMADDGGFNGIERYIELAEDTLSEIGRLKNE